MVVLMGGFLVLVVILAIHDAGKQDSSRVAHLPILGRSRTT